MNKNTDDDFVMVQIGQKNSDVAHHGGLGSKEYPADYGSKAYTHDTNTGSLWKAIFGEALDAYTKEGERQTYLENVKPTKPPAPLGRSLSLSDFNY
tara:strand:+ start:177 stop:464 length:288 start_codon:yes stop_codon:yes gene_type:complete